jgi:hypothetical protein
MGKSQALRGATRGKLVEMKSSEQAPPGAQPERPNQISSSEKLTHIRDQVKQIWERARSNAFAHREAAEEYAQEAAELFVRQLYSGMLSVFSIILLYITLPTDSGGVEVPVIWTKVLSGILTLTSVGLSIYSLMEGIKQNYRGYEKLQVLHDHNQHSYLSIAQRAREVRFFGIDEDRAMSILEDLERDFQLLKVRGIEPANRHFLAGDALLAKLKSGPESERQSFDGDDSA